MKNKLTRNVITTVCELVGAALVVAGIGSIALSAGIIAGGIVLILIGYFLA